MKTKSKRQSIDSLIDNLPSDTEAEKLLIGCLIVDSRRFHDVSHKVGPQDFVDEQHKAVYSAIVDLMSSGVVDGSPRNGTCILDTKAIQDRVRDRFRREFRIADYAQSVGTGWDFMYYAHRIGEMAIRRAVVLANYESMQSASRPDHQVANVLDAALRNVSDIGAGRGTSGRVRPLSRVIQDELIPKIERDVFGGPDDEMFIGTGWRNIDRILGRLHRGSLVILAGRPGEGKTSLACNLAANVAIRESRRVLFITLEQPQREIAENVWRSVAKVGPIDEAYSPDDRKERLHKLLGETAVIQSETFLLWEGSSVSVEYIESLCRSQSALDSLDLVVIDYLGLIKKPREIQNVTYQIEYITGRLKQLAKQLNVPIVLLCQLSRESEKDKSGEPSLRHLRDSGAIEQDSDAVVMVWRPGSGSNAKVKIAKNRHGITGTTELEFVGEFKRFFEPEPKRVDAFDRFNERGSDNF